MRVTHPRRLACVWLLSALVLGAARAPAGEPAPAVAVDAAVHDFGAVEQGATVEHVFRLRNTGTSALRIDHVKGTCACTVGVATGEAIVPGDEAWVTVRLDTARLAGRTTKTATVYTNDPLAPTVAVTLTGEVLTDLVVRPTPLYLGHVHRGAVVRREIVVAPGRPGGTASVLAVEAASPRIRAWIEPDPGGVGQRVVVELDSAASSGRFSDDLVLRTSSARQPSMTVKVLGTIDGHGGDADPDRRG
jgi:hypothetical protein